jgi:hypothetical protein
LRARVRDARDAGDADDSEEQRDDREEPQATSVVANAKLFVEATSARGVLLRSDRSLDRA